MYIIYKYFSLSLSLPPSIYIYIERENFLSYHPIALSWSNLKNPNINVLNVFKSIHSGRGKTFKELFLALTTKIHTLSMGVKLKSFGNLLQ